MNFFFNFEDLFLGFYLFRCDFSNVMSTIIFVKYQDIDN